MRYAMAAIPVFIGHRRTPGTRGPVAQRLCGAVGAGKLYPSRGDRSRCGSQSGTVITVTNATMAINGDTSSWRRWSPIRPGTGISLQEAVIATITTPAHGTSSSPPALKVHHRRDSGPNIKAESYLCSWIGPPRP